MRKLIFLLLFVIPFAGSAQFTDNFSDGNFTSNPTWAGDVSEFTVNASQQLQLNSSGTSVSYLSSNLNLTSLDSTEWRCFVRQSFSGSSTNNGKIYLVSDQSNLEGPLNGYYIQLGEALSNDAVELFRQSGITSTSVARCTNGAIANSFAIGIKVTRSANAIWKIYIDYTGGTNYLPGATGTDATYNASSFFGVVCAYTSSNATNFYFDDFSYSPIQIDSISPFAVNAVVISTTEVDVIFSEALEITNAEMETNYTADNGLGIPVSSLIDSVNISLVHLTFTSAFSPGTANTLTINNVSDLNNNVIISNSTINFVLPATPAKNEVLINEILFNPRPDEFDFVELYNNSDKIFDLTKLYLANTDNNDSIDTYEPVSTSLKYFYPKTYLLVTENLSSIISQFTTDTSNYIQTDIPSYNDDEDVVVILDNAFNRLDQFNYTDKLQYPLLDIVEGVSLERISFSRSSSDNSNWHSAAQSAGFATPGYKNSQYIDDVNTQNELTLSPEIFSPDNDGYNDVISFLIALNASGYVLNADIYNEDGRLMKKLVKSKLLSPKDAFSWDGITDKNEKAATGIYIIYAQAFNTTGDVKKFKKAFVLANKL